MPARRHDRIADLVANDRVVLLDGATGTELIDVAGTRPERDERLWGVGAILDRPDDVRAVHRHYAEVGCDVVTTGTWGLPTALGEGAPQPWDLARPVHWMDVARAGVRLAREATEQAGRGEEVAVAFSLNGDVDTPDGHETIRLLGRALEDEPPDLILLETLSLVRGSTYATVERLLETGVPLWLSFRRCRHGVCGVYGEHWGGPEGDAFGRAARRFEEMGVGALLVNCIPPDHVTGMIAWLRDFTDLPLGVYPNLGYLSADGWRHEGDIGGAEYAQLALRWREEGAQIVGGCCGVGPEHLAAAAEALAGTRPGHSHPAPLHGTPESRTRTEDAPARWTDARGRALYPLAVPDLVVEPPLPPPGQDDLMIWKHLYREVTGAQQRCLDVGCGAGLRTVQLALNGAAHVHALDVDEAAVRSTLASAFRNGVSGRVSAAAVDLFPWVPDERYDLIVANVPQQPVDPFEQVTTHRPRDFWGRSLLDHLIRLLPEALAPDGTAYLAQRSIIGERRTTELLEELGYVARVVELGFLGLSEGAREQVARVEAGSDAYHVALGDGGATVVYLLEVTADPARRR